MLRSLCIHVNPRRHTVLLCDIRTPGRHLHLPPPPRERHADATLARLLNIKMGAARPPQAAQMPATQAGSGCCPDALGPPRTVIRSQPARRPLGDITNFEDVRLGSEDAVLRLKEQKSKRAREKYASLPEEKKEEKRAKARASYYRRKSIKEHSMLPNQKTSVPNDLFPDAATDEMTRLGQSNDIDGDGFQDDDWLHRNDLYVRHSVDECKKTCEDCNGVFPTMSSTVINGARDNTPYSAFKREKLREQYSRLSADAKHDKSTRSMEMRARRNSTRQVHDTPQQSALTQHASRPSAMMTRAGVRGVQKLFDSGLWEPDDPMHGVEENDLDNQDLDDGDVDMYDDAEPRPSNNRDFRYRCYRQPNFQMPDVDPFDFNVTLPLFLTTI